MGYQRNTSIKSGIGEMLMMDVEENHQVKDATDATDATNGKTTGKTTGDTTAARYASVTNATEIETKMVEMTEDQMEEYYVKEEEAYQLGRRNANLPPRKYKRKPIPNQHRRPTGMSTVVHENGETTDITTGSEGASGVPIPKSRLDRGN